MAVIERVEVVGARRGRTATVDPKLAAELADVAMDGSNAVLIEAFGKKPIESDKDRAAFRAKITAAWRQRDGVRDDDGNVTTPLSVVWHPTKGLPQVFVKTNA